jgi:signal transduction histidine kinase
MANPAPPQDPLGFAALIAHQMKSPVSAAGSLVKTVLGGFVGELNPAQADMLRRADLRLSEATASISRLLLMANPGRMASPRVVDVAPMARRIQADHAQAAADQGVALVLDARLDPAPVRADEQALAEAVLALLVNALQHTPEGGRVVLAVAASQDGDQVVVSVDDSGPGVPEPQWERVFEPFVRLPPADRPVPPGMGLGLAYVRTVAGASGGRAGLEASRLGGARAYLALPRAGVLGG